MDETMQMATEFLRWWADPKSAPGFSRRFAREFTYRSEPAGVTDADALWLIEQQMPWADVVVKSQRSEGDVADIVLEATDPVTNLRHRVTLAITVRGGLIISVHERIEDVT